MARYKLTVEYDGGRYFGWQRQEGLPTVQAALEMGLQKLCNGTEITVFCAGRTDAGVHAYGQVVHADLPAQLEPHNVIMGTNFYLKSEQVVVVDAVVVADDFHARFGATGRRYRYHILNRTARLALDAERAWHVPETLDADAMHAAAQLLVGTHDFTSFRASECQSASPIKTLRQLDVRREGDRIIIDTESKSFLHHQVRNMVGTLRRIGNGFWTQDDLLEILAARRRAASGETAPAHGLFFMEVSY